MAFTIVPAQEKDLADVRYITQTTIRSVYPHYYPAGAVRFFSEHHSDEHILADLKGGKVYLLESEGRPVGTVTISGNEINRLFVLPEMQHRGFGKALLEFAESKMWEKYPVIRLDASLPAKRIYRKRGYVDTEYHVIDTENGDHLCYDVMERKLIHVAAAVIRDGDKIFTVQRGYGDYKDKWEFPGGKLEKGETPEEALRREIREELNTEIAIHEHLMKVQYDYPQFHLTMDCFWCSVVSGELTLLEAEDARWLTKEDIWSVDWLPADDEVLKKIEKQL